MFSQITGAFVRGLLVMVLLATPSLMLPGVNTDTTQIVALVSLFAAALTFFEYASTYPGLVEFRDAPPFNRIRYLSLLATVMLLAAIVRGQTQPTTMTEFLTAIGTQIGLLIDVPYSPVRLVVLMLPNDMDPNHIALVRTAAGLSYLISLLTLVVFIAVLWLLGWPSRMGTFNVWINLPTFDPTAGGDVVDRLTRDSRFNIAFGVLLPFIIPATLKIASLSFSPVTLESPHTLIWTMTAWAFLPASLFMRGIAMGRIARMIATKRRMQGQSAEAEYQLA
ncbi:hypothetical protein OU426_14915 [Frigidibacter sp. RF13]|uniref:hypothetical protein n=1 Tax=Frigidibacter sp. RF13 TaxID=2997340 RepID=UPI002271CE09|nr:hypothetical protein [Frigidibacter sp. RF13]MCY1128154.1 hypothetical protein [Frigidibacter sp. RF13]